MTTIEQISEDIEFSDLDLPKISAKEEIETVIYSLEQNDSAMVQATDDGYIWKFQYGTVEVFVQLTGESDDDLLTIWSNVLPLPAKNEPQLFRQLMELNWSGTFETCFSILNNQVVLSAQRTVNDLSPAEISRLITLVATIADQYDEPLQAEYL
ncbi:YbjN domain-containing protein [Geminocystis sp. CENA526]|uniref:YbjN domain-containing protein n=1 Tax=Geminocystis sp. CENA526 TaxID=1355871 RepID=UPI003D6E86D6